MSLLLDKTGHFVRLQRNRKAGLQKNPHDFLLYSAFPSSFGISAVTDTIDFWAASVVWCLAFFGPVTDAPLIRRMPQ